MQKLTSIAVLVCLPLPAKQGRNVMKYVLMLAALVVAVTPAHAGWGCVAKNRAGYFHRNWDQDSKEQASSDALASCNTKYGGCAIFKCVNGVNSRDDAHRLLNVPGSHAVR